MLTSRETDLVSSSQLRQSKELLILTSLFYGPWKAHPIDAARWPLRSAVRHAVSNKPVSMTMALHAGGGRDQAGEEVFGD